MNRYATLFAATLLAGLVGCTDEPEETEPPAGDVPIAAEYADFELDTIGWWQRGTPVQYGGRDWVPVGWPILDPIVTAEPVGTFEGTALYAPASDAMPHDQLFFHLDDEYWQALAPLDALPDTASITPEFEARRTGAEAPEDTGG